MASPSWGVERGEGDQSEHLSSLCTCTTGGSKGSSYICHLVSYGVPRVHPGERMEWWAKKVGFQAFLFKLEQLLLVTAICIELLYKIQNEAGYDEPNGAAVQMVSVWIGPCRGREDGESRAVRGRRHHQPPWVLLKMEHQWAGNAPLPVCRKAPPSRRPCKPATAQPALL